MKQFLRDRRRRAQGLAPKPVAARENAAGPKSYLCRLPRRPGRNWLFSRARSGAAARRREEVAAWYGSAPSSGWRCQTMIGVGLYRVELGVLAKEYELRQINRQIGRWPREPPMCWKRSGAG